MIWVKEKRGKKRKDAIIVKGAGTKPLIPQNCFSGLILLALPFCITDLLPQERFQIRPKGHPSLVGLSFYTISLHDSLSA